MATMGRPRKKTKTAKKCIGTQLSLGTYAALARQAKLNCRSLNGEINHRLEASLQAERVLEVAEC